MTLVSRETLYDIAQEHLALRREALDKKVDELEKNLNERLIEVAKKGETVLFFDFPDIDTMNCVISRLKAAGYTTSLFDSGRRQIKIIW